MAFTTQEETYLKVLAASYIQAGYTSQAQVVAALTRQRLEQELAALQSAENNLRAGFATDTGEFNEALEALQAAKIAKQSEIDQL